MTDHPRLLVYSAGVRGGAILGPATRAGAMGVLDLAWPEVDDRDGSLAAIRRVARRFDRPFAVRIHADLATDGWLAALPAGATTVILVAPTAADLDEAPGRIRAAGRTAWAEVGDRDAAARAEASGAAGLILVGNEAGGFVGDDSSFILLQAVLARSALPAWVRGGVGPRVAAACRAIGAAGVVLDGALLLASESPLTPDDRARVARWDGGETRVFGPADGPRVRVHVPPGSAVAGRLAAASEAGGPAWDAAIRAEVGWGPGQAWPVGQDAALAGRLAPPMASVVELISAFDRAEAEHARAADRARPLDAGSPLAAAHGTRYPILQGPMTRVSDVVEFAGAVADGGALPFLALAMLPGDAATALLGRARSLLAGKPWGVGLLGFVSPELRREQVAAVRAARPPFALIAGGRPDQAAELEAEGIATYLHVPSPGLLDQFLRAGARRFVLEGRECGGHVGPRSSFVLWEQALDVVERAIAGGVAADEIHLVLAGGIHDDRSARFVATLAAPVAALGVKVGVLIGTAYLFTREAVATGAIVDRYQAEALRCGRTTLLETGPGHEVRVGPSPFVAAFDAERRRLRDLGVVAEAAREALEQLNAGRLRVATKGVERANGAGSPLVPVARDDQFDRGIYMLGQVATLKDRITTIAELHAAIAGAQPAAAIVPAQPAASPSDIAIVGMSAILPGAGDVRTFWENTLRRHDAVTEVPADRWDWRLYYDADPKAPDKVVSKWGGFVPDVPFDPLRYGMPPASLTSIEPVQLLLLEATRAAIADAGYADRPFARERAAVVLGMGGGAAQLAMGYAFRSYLPMLDAVTPGAGSAALDACRGLLPEWTEDSFPGFLLNVAAGRLANRFDLGGANYTVDAACGSSLAAAALAVRELETGAADVVLLGGADTVQNPFTYLAFSKTHAFSPRGRCRPFDASADGIVISEGVAMVVLKRLADAERDGDRIYAVIKGLGASSDGRARGLTAPSPAGQVRAVERAYAKAGVGPATVGYVEAHGTGTAVGDVVEVNAIAGVFREQGAAEGSVAIGSVKSMIGHTKCAAGLAGLINASLALHHKVLPPTLGVATINPKADLADGPFRVNTAARPWLAGPTGHPRRAGVSAFGFGGTNFHAVLEAYDAPAPPPRRDWPAELFLWRAVAPAALGADLDRLIGRLDAGARPPLRDLAAAVNRANPARPQAGPTLAVVAGTHAELAERLRTAREAIARRADRLDDPRGVFYRAKPEFAGARVAFLFPGQGSQAPGMLADLAIAFPEVAGAVEAVDAALVAAGQAPVGPLIFPPAAVDDDGRARAAAALAATAVAQPALGAAGVGLLRLLGALGVEPDMVAGHSFGELVALHAAGAFGVAGLARLAADRGRLMLAAIGDEPGGMAAVAAGVEVVRPLLGSFRQVTAVNENGPTQTVIAGPRRDLAAATRRLADQGLRVKDLPVAGAFHTHLVASVRVPLTEAARREVEAPPDRPVYSNLDANPYPADRDAIADRLGEHAARPVRFGAMVAALHRDGARVFVEVGPGSILTRLVGPILGDRPHLAVACDSASRPGLATFLTALARLAVAGVPVRLDRLAEGRSTRALDLADLPAGDGSPPLAASTWLVNGSRSRPIDRPEPKRLGQAAALLGLDPPPASAPAVATPGPAAIGAGVTPSLNGNGSHPAGSPNHGKAMTPPKPTDVRPPAPTPSPAAAPGGSAEERVLASFQETMRTFLDVQRETMLAFLGARPAAPSAAAPPRVARPLAPTPLMAAPAPAAAPAVAPPAPVAAPILPPPTPLPPVPALVAVVPPPPAAAGREDVAARLVEIVRDRTGYPAEMLGLDLDLEADLGIDSIKRVEILGTLRDSVAALAGSADGRLMDSLTRARTLGAIVERVDEFARRQASQSMPASHAGGGNGRARESRPAPAAVGAGAATGGDADGDPDPAASAGVRRLLIEPVAAPLASFGAGGGIVPGGVVVVTDDGRGVARALGDRFEAEGHPVVHATPGRFDLGSPASVDLLLEKARALGLVAAVVHAAPLRAAEAAGLDPARWAARLGPEVRGLFLLAKGAAGDLERAARHGGAALVAATAMGGTFGTRPTPGDRDFFPGHGGVAGLVKTLAREWPSVRSRVVDLDPREAAATLADRLLDEVLVDDGWSEVGYPAGRRVRLAAVPARVDRAGGTRLVLDPEEPIILTGGARGITAAVAAELARAWRPRLLMIGRGPLPDAVEAAATAGIEATGDLKAALLDRLKRAGGGVTPADLERAYRAVRRDREIRANLDAIRAAGSVVEYAQADVRDAEGLGRVVADWRARFGPAAGLVHGAGVIQDKLIRDKTLASFDAVLGTKLDGALNLARLLDGDRPKFAALFASIAGRFGNSGQSDYAAANEVLNKLALWLDRRWPGRVVAVNWGPWSEVGMVADLEGHLGARGLGMIPPAAGRALLLDELRYGAKGQVEIVAAGNLGDLEAPIARALPPAEPAAGGRGSRR